MKKAEIRELDENESILIQAKEEIPPGHLQAVADALEKYIKENKGPHVIALDSRFSLTICNNNSIYMATEMHTNCTPEEAN